MLNKTTGKEVNVCDRFHVSMENFIIDLFNAYSFSW